MIDAAGTHVIYEVKHLEKSFGKVEVLKDINIQIGNGEVLTIIGPSGSGKSTFLRCLNLLEKPTGGELWFNGRLIDRKTDVKMLRRDVGMVFQSFNLFPMFSAVENVMYAPVHINKLDKKQAKEEAMELLSRVGMADRANHYPGELSGGQQQRVALARATVIEPSVLLFDEPLSNLDAKLREYMRGELRALQKRLGITSLYVTHDQAEAMAISDRIVIMRDGRIQQVGTPEEIYEHPNSRFTANFIGRANFINAVAVKRSGNIETVRVMNKTMDISIEPYVKVSDGAECFIAFRPESAKLTTDATRGICGTVVKAVYFGSRIEYDGEFGGERVTVEISNPTASERYREGDTVYLEIDENSACVLTE